MVKKRKEKKPSEENSDFLDLDLEDKEEAEELDLEAVRRYIG